MQYREKKIPADDTVSFAAVAEYNAKLFGRYAGTPLAWPANWVFARAHDLPAARYDLMVGKYLFYRQNNLGGLVKVGDGRADPALFAGEWSAPAPCGEGTCREVTGRARVMAPLDVAEDLDVIGARLGPGHPVAGRQRRSRGLVPAGRRAAGPAGPRPPHELAPGAERRVLVGGRGRRGLRGARGLRADPAEAARRAELLNTPEYERMYAAEDRQWWYAGMRAISFGLLDAALRAEPEEAGPAALRASSSTRAAVPA